MFIIRKVVATVKEIDTEVKIKLDFSGIAVFHGVYRSM